MATPLRWGILGTGNIARQFANGVNDGRRGVLQAVASRQLDPAKQFAAANKVGNAVGSYDELVRRADVDAVYVSLPNSLHKEWTIKSLRAGKHVLCEKPFALNAGEAEEMFDVANREGKVLVEAFMYRSHPQTQRVLDLVRGGAIGAVQMVRTSFCFRVRNTDTNVRFVPALGGGALMDVGCYCVSFSRLIAGEEPAQLHAYAHKHPTGVDDVTIGQMVFPGGVMATFTCGMMAQADNTAYVCGTEGYVEIPVPWKPPVMKAVHYVKRNVPARMDLGTAAPTPPPVETFEVDAGGNMYTLEAEDFARTVLDGQPPRVSRQDTIGNMKVLDALRRQIGVEF